MITNKIDWGSFLARHDMTWVVKPISWDEGAFLGNGQIGAMVYAEEHRAKRNVLRFVLGHTDITARRATGSGFPPRVPIGELDLELVGHLYQPTTLRLDLWNAELRAEIMTTVGKVSLRAFVHSTRPVLCVELTTTEEERGAALRWYANPEVDPVLKNADGFNLNQYIPDTTVDKWDTNGMSFGVQRYPSGEGCVTAWKVVPDTPLTCKFLLTVRNGAGDAEVRQAQEDLATAGKLPWQELVQSHRAWWHAYYPQSFVSLPDTRLEGFYWIQMYKLASATRSDGKIIDNQGPWLAPTPWAGVWFNMNVQMSYSPVYTSGRLSIGESLVKSFREQMPNLIGNVPEAYRHDSAGLGRSCSYDLKAKVGDETGNLTWVCHNLWRHYRHSMDDELLRELLYPLLRRSVNFYLHILEEGEDGKLHLPPSVSPEYGSFKQLTVPDCHYDLALLAWGCRTLIRICERLGVQDELHSKWDDVLVRLTPLPTDPEEGFLLGKGQSLEFGHRHFSHLQAIFPLHIVSGETDEERALILRTLRHWIGKEGDLRGFSFTSAASVAAAIGLGDEALQYIRTMLHLFKPNTMYKEAGPVIESPLAGAESLHDLLLQSWGDGIRVFPAVPSEWADVVFHDLRAEGGFLVSAKRERGRTAWIRIRSLAGEPCRLRTDWEPDAPVACSKPGACRMDGSGWLTVELQQGEEAVLYPDGALPAEFDVHPLPAQPHLCGYFGGHKPWKLYGLPNR
ncbi:glycoside hydrolase family 95-like protein [Paenibacillus allorhizosphaerae]|uniref:Alpha-L-fucosidase n=1 Tax=Paenibacillus allorhizosphaerae TaxID=2849866 RepID=A0ABN7TKA0_9BACL|nr:hypothetical protein [Paenibacillus allorhizosphaerae]CAG7643027.1 hypothetical protein PAECIP111802_02940 [Paenibacillus allorhizosphaerae]